MWSVAWAVAHLRRHSRKKAERLGSCFAIWEVSSSKFTEVMYLLVIISTPVSNSGSIGVWVIDGGPCISACTFDNACTQFSSSPSLQGGVRPLFGHSSSHAVKEPSSLLCSVGVIRTEVKLRVWPHWFNYFCRSNLWKILEPKTSSFRVRLTEMIWMK